VHGGEALAALLAERYGVGLLPRDRLRRVRPHTRIRAATSGLYGETDAERFEALGGSSIRETTARRLAGYTGPDGSD